MRPTAFFFRSTPTTFYRPSFYKHLHNLAISGFYARELDADDHAFLETVRVKGIANGELPGQTDISLEELDFWKFPYAIEPGIERKAGPLPKPERETPEQREQRRLRSNRWYARRAIREQERAIAAVELERETREHEAANDRRKIREQISDAEWDAAAPKEAPFGTEINRHYVPEWKLEEQGIVQPVKTKGKTRMMSRAEVREALERQRRIEEKQDRKRKLIAEKARIRKAQIAAEEERKAESRKWTPEKAAKLAQEKQAQQTADRARANLAKKKYALTVDGPEKARAEELARKRHEREQERKQREQANRLNQQAREQAYRERILQEARQTVDRINQLEREWQDAPVPMNPNVLKRQLLDLIRSNAPRVSSLEELMRGTGCADRQFVLTCLREMVAENHLKRVG
jgi:hypothetical protein